MINIKTKKEVEKMRVAGEITGNTLKLLVENAKVGASTYDLDKMAEKYIRSQGAEPSFLGYGGYPASVCISINEEVVHGIPRKDKYINEGDIVSFDVGAYIGGFHGDAARSVLMGENEEKQKLIEVTKESFFKGIEQFKEGNRLGDISHAIQAYAESFGYGVVRDLTGHGIGREMHEDPEVLNFGKAGHGARLQKFMAIAIEPMINMGTYKVDFDQNDGWTVRTSDRQPSAHYENTVVLTDNGVEILTL